MNNFVVSCAVKQLTIQLPYKALPVVVLEEFW
jgi:hypothetical protein